MFPPDPVNPHNADSQADFEAHLAALIANLPEGLLQNLRIMLSGCGQSALAVWREADVEPTTITELEQLTGLTEDRVRQMTEAAEPELVGRILLTAPCRLHALAVLGIGLFGSRLLDRFTRFMNEPGRLSGGTWETLAEAAQEIGQLLITRFEENSEAVYYDLEDVLTNRTTTAETPRYSGEDLRLRRLQLEGLIARALLTWQPRVEAAVAEPERVAHPAASAANSEHPDYDFYHAPLLETSYLTPQITMLMLATALPQTLHVLPDHAFGQAVRHLRWLGHADWLQGLNKRLGGLTEAEPIAFSLTELMILYQGAQLVALALVAEALPEIDRQLAALWAEVTDGEADPAELAFPQLSQHFSGEADENGASPSRVVCGMVEGFVHMVQGAFAAFDPADPETAPYQHELAVAQQEIDVLAPQLAD